MSYPNFSGVEKLIIANNILSSQESMMKQSNSNSSTISNSSIPMNPDLYQDSHNPFSMAPPATNYSAQEMAHSQQQHAYFQLQQQHQLRQQQYQQQQNPHHQLQAIAHSHESTHSSAYPTSTSIRVTNVQYSQQCREQQQPTPKNKRELEMYELLKRANLIDYFGSFIRHGGDDVQQLADVDEEEFLEIMELVEMTTKPLHMRRLQKALNNWRLENGDERLESAHTFRKPHSGALYDSGLCVGDTRLHVLSHHEYASSNAAHNESSLSIQSSLADSIAAPTSTAARSLFPVSESEKLASKVSESPIQQYSTPHVIKNAPKKPRLMDSIVPSDLTKGLQYDDGPIRSTPRLNWPPMSSERSRFSPARDDEHPNLAAYSPPESPASSDSDDSEQLIEVGVPDKNVVSGAIKRKQGLKRPAALSSSSAAAKQPKKSCKLSIELLSDTAAAADVAAVQVKAPEPSNN